MKLRFPFPDSKMSSNSRISHRWLTKERETARTVGYWITKDAKLSFPKNSMLEMKILICPPDKRHRDDDNILTAFKSTRDGIFKALDMDDSCVRRTILEFGETEKGGALYVEFSILA